MLDEIDALARARAARRRLPGAAARPALVVLRQPRGHAPLPRADHRDRGLLQHRRLQRRHPRLLLDPGPPRHGAAGRLRLPRHARRHRPAAPRTRRTSSRPTSPTASPRRPTGSDHRERNDDETHCAPSPRSSPAPSIAGERLRLRDDAALVRHPPRRLSDRRGGARRWAGSSRRRPTAASASRSSTRPSSARRRTPSSRPASG